MLSEIDIEMQCDNEAVVNIPNREDKFCLKYLDMDESDLVKTGNDMLEQFPRTTLQHIKGRQMDGEMYKDLPFET